VKVEEDEEDAIAGGRGEGSRDRKKQEKNEPPVDSPTRVVREFVP